MVNPTIQRRLFAFLQVTGPEVAPADPVSVLLLIGARSDQPIDKRAPPARPPATRRRVAARPASDRLAIPSAVGGCSPRRAAPLRRDATCVVPTESPLGIGRGGRLSDDNPVVIAIGATSTDENTRNRGHQRRGRSPMRTRQESLRGHGVISERTGDPVTECRRCSVAGVTGPATSTTGGDRNRGSARSPGASHSASSDLVAELGDARPGLVAHCYRMLGSPFEAEDAVQEAALRAWRHLDEFDEDKGRLRSWLYAIATNVCLDMLRSTQRRASAVDMAPAAVPGSPLGAPLPERAWVLPIPDRLGVSAVGDPADLAEQRNAIRLAFVVALQRLPPRQRAVLLLRDVLSWRAGEVARLLDSSVASVNSALQRARSTLDVTHRSPAEELQPMSARQRDLLARYCDAFERYDVETLVSLLHEDAVMSMPPFAWWLRGRADIGQVLAAAGRPCEGSVLRPTMANGRPAFWQYRPAGLGRGQEPFALVTIEMRGELIGATTSFLDAARLYPLFEVAAEDSSPTKRPPSLIGDSYE